MNKHCTNSSCRRTFSTLSYGGKCPFCGKRYPQIFSARKKPEGNNWLKKNARLHILDRRIVSVDITEPWRLLREGLKVKAIKELLAVLRSKGYNPGLRNAKYFIDDMQYGRTLCKTWVLTGEDSNWGKAIEPKWHD